MSITAQGLGKEPSYRPLGLPGRYDGIHYQPVILDEGELVVFVGQVRYEWRPNPYLYGPPAYLFNAYTGEPHPHRDFVWHVDRVCDRRLERINS